MMYRVIPGTDLECSCIALGTSQMGSDLDLEGSSAMLDAYVEAGGNLLDSANCYCNWNPKLERSTSEKTIGRWLKAKGCRDRVVLGTKGGHPDFAPPSGVRLSRAEVMHDIEASLANLGVERIDLYWLHRDDRARPVEAVMETLALAVGQGKLRYLGCSNWRADRIAAAQAAAAANGWPAFVADQPMWNLAVVDAEAIGDPTVAVMDPDLLSLHTCTGLAAVPFSGQANGLFMKMAQGTVDTMSAFHRHMYRSEENGRRFARIQQLCLARGLSPTQVALGYLTSQPFVTIPIVGCRNLEQLADSLTAADVSLSADEVRSLVGE
jgi:aryl-alcohol dehydrogenase-like predicted oxidoreductase